MNNKEKELTIAWCVEMMITLEFIPPEMYARKIQTKEMFKWDNWSILCVQQYLIKKGIAAGVIPALNEYQQPKIGGEQNKIKQKVGGNKKVLPKIG